MIRTRKLGHIALRVSDIERLRDFYAAVLNMQVTSEDPVAEECTLDGIQRAAREGRPCHAVVAKQLCEARMPGSVCQPRDAHRVLVGVAHHHVAQDATGVSTAIRTARETARLFASRRRWTSSGSGPAGRNQAPRPLGARRQHSSPKR